MSGETWSGPKAMKNSSLIMNDQVPITNDGRKVSVTGAMQRIRGDLGEKLAYRVQEILAFAALSEIIAVVGCILHEELFFRSSSVVGGAVMLDPPGWQL